MRPANIVLPCCAVLWVQESSAPSIPGAAMYSLGSVAEHAINHASHPVITVPRYTPPLVIPMAHSRGHTPRT